MRSFFVELLIAIASSRFYSRKSWLWEKATPLPARTGGGRGGGGGLPDFFFLFSFPYSADHERDWSTGKVVFFGLATNTLSTRNKV